MCRIKFVIVLLCLVNFVQPRTLYYPNPNDPSAIVFEGPTNYKETRKSAENEVSDEDPNTFLIDPRFGDNNEALAPPPPAPRAPVDGGFYFPDD